MYNQQTTADRILEAVSIHITPDVIKLVPKGAGVINSTKRTDIGFDAVITSIGYQKPTIVVHKKTFLTRARATLYAGRYKVALNKLLNVKK